MVSEVERVTQTRSNPSPASSVDYTRASQEDLQRLESRTEARLKECAKENTDLKSWINAALSDMQHTAHAARTAFNEEVTAIDEKMSDTRT